MSHPQPPEAIDFYPHHIHSSPLFHSPCHPLFALLPSAVPGRQVLGFVEAAMNWVACIPYALSCVMLNRNTANRWPVNRADGHHSLVLWLWTTATLGIYYVYVTGYLATVVPMLSNPVIFTPLPTLASRSLHEQ